MLTRRTRATLKIGDTGSFSKTITEKDVFAFAEPSGRLRAADRHQLGLLRPVQNRRRGALFSLLTLQGRLQTLFHPSLPHGLNRPRRDSQRFGDPPVTPAWAPFRH